MSTNGYLTIKTKIDNKDIDKGIQELENKIKKLQADNYNQKLKELNAEKQKMIQSNPELAVERDSTELSNLKTQIDSINQKYSQAVSEIDKQAPKIDKVYSNLSKVKAKQTENNAKISEYKQKIESIKSQHIENSLNNVGKTISNQISSIGKMAMGIIGIKTAWGAVRSAVSLVSQYDTQTATNLEYMRYVLANAIIPVIQRLISLVMTLLSYINAITSAWFGINLFSNASAKNFQKMQKGASSTAKSAKEIQKSLQGFDEMNILSDNSDSGTSGGGSSGIDAPSMDLSSMQAPVPAWLQWIIDNKDLIFQILAGIAAGTIAIKFGLDGIKALGIGVLVAGIVGTIKSLIDYFNDPSWENFGKIISNIGLILLGVGIIIGNVPLIIAGAIAVIVGLVVSNWEKIHEFLQNGIDWLFSQMDWVKEKFGIVGTIIYTAFLFVLQIILDAFDGLFRGIKTILDGIMQVFRRNIYRRYENCTKWI